MGPIPEREGLDTAAHHLPTRKGGQGQKEHPSREGQGAQSSKTYTPNPLARWAPWTQADVPKTPTTPPPRSRGTPQHWGKTVVTGVIRVTRTLYPFLQMP